MLTHLDEQLSREFLDVFQAWLGEDGVLVFTVHGGFSANLARLGVTDYGLDRSGVDTLLKGYDERGYGYANYPTQRGYGISLTSRRWIMEWLDDTPTLRLLTYTEMAWDHHQDVIACTRQCFEKRLARARKHWASF